VPYGHRSVWGSWYCTDTQRWGYSCCRKTSRHAPPCCQEPATSAAESESGGAPPAAAAAAASEWKPREAFGTAEGFVAHAMRHLAACWTAWLRDGALAAQAPALSPSAAAVLLSERAAREAVGSVEDFCGRLYQQLLAPDLVAKLEDICGCIHAREYAQANRLYVELTIGARKWLSDLPVFVRFDAKRQDTDVRWTPESGRSPLDEAGVRGHVVLLRRLLAVAQAVRPNADPSKNCG